MKHDQESLCRSIMSDPPTVLKPADSVSVALQTMVRERLPALPVVDTDGRYVGMLPRSRLVALAMPRVLSHDTDQQPLARLLRVGFIRDSLADLQERMAAAANDPVSQHLDREVPVLSPDTPLMNALLFLYRQRNVLPVVENGKLLGIVSVWDVLARIGRVK
ncbi:MAG TPA: CBS domain-containing protein [Accumulibacter sp.]|uniref:CBS domain-containing protein n=1 Tax=Accumulibacter sp. TaxID=2053492 RepID=UPI00258F5C7D|nr:CBS domain-containing protein [Accumulibacter sp.]MCM8579273.1 CBS domain-containing protein [Accumulibacter sp.]MCQ1547717.1 CBS domain-containing protein [Candidatus Accumulibacter phosphatis]HMW54761.1 CBS domain-containing protein [Accumulibacter sp.]HNF90968.1 CBS domain-containing protein [Accumulibacter sp.]